MPGPGLDRALVGEAVRRRVRRDQAVERIGERIRIFLFECADPASRDGSSQDVQIAEHDDRCVRRRPPIVIVTRFVDALRYGSCFAISSVVFAPEQATRTVPARRDGGTRGKTPRGGVCPSRRRRPTRRPFQSSVPADVPVTPEWRNLLGGHEPRCLGRGSQSNGAPRLASPDRDSGRGVAECRRLHRSRLFSRPNAARRRLALRPAVGGSERRSPLLRHIGLDLNRSTLRSA